MPGPTKPPEPPKRDLKLKVINGGASPKRKVLEKNKKLILIPEVFFTLKDYPDEHFFTTGIEHYNNLFLRINGTTEIIEDINKRGMLELAKLVQNIRSVENTINLKNKNLLTLSRMLNLWLIANSKRPEAIQILQEEYLRIKNPIIRIGILFYIEKLRRELNNPKYEYLFHTACEEMYQDELLLEQKGIQTSTRQLLLTYLLNETAKTL